MFCRDLTKRPQSRSIKPLDGSSLLLGFLIVEMLSGPDAAHDLKRVLPQRKARENHAVLQAALAYDRRPHLAGLSMPTMIMVGEKNPATHKRAKAMSDSIKQCRFIVIPHAGHIANRDAPGFVNTKLKSLLQAKP